ncbi:MAG: Cys-tRNA(Pro) deacylase [Betaproteobacteria bacterium]|nr:Cys-tRNA(Pro) deacylase [Betaproteobacteria bacterium]
MSKDRLPVTNAVRVLREHGVAFTDHPYPYEERGGTAVSARELDVPEHQVVKTLIMEDERRRPLCVLMHGDRAVSTKNLARHLGVKTVSPCAPAVADRHSGYQVGGTSPFGTKRSMPVYMQATIAELPRAKCSARSCTSSSGTPQGSTRWSTRLNTAPAGGNAALLAQDG